MFFCLICSWFTLTYAVDSKPWYTSRYYGCWVTILNHDYSATLHCGCCGHPAAMNCETWVLMGKRQLSLQFISWLEFHHGGSWFFWQLEKPVKIPIKKWIVRHEPLQGGFKHLGIPYLPWFDHSASGTGWNHLAMLTSLTTWRLGIP